MKREDLSTSGIQSRQSRDAALAKRITAALLLAICMVAAALM
jgi:hypothetical protein